MSGNRLPQAGRIDRSCRVNFSFDGKNYQGYAGDSLASALLANGVVLLGRSFKYHRPRGLVAHSSAEPNALVNISRDAARTTPNLRAPCVPLYEGLCAKSQNRWPSLRHDAGAINNILSRFFVAGFYNKTFMWPKSFWDRLYEPAIRRMAGLGVAPRLPDPDSYAASYAHCEVLIVGAGRAGLEAALEAAQDSTKRIILLDEGEELGGSMLSVPQDWPWLEAALATLNAAPNVTLLPRTTGFGLYHDNFVGAVERITEHLADTGAQPREKLWRIRAAEVVLAQGAIERPLVFSNNDLPGIMLMSAARVLALHYGVAAGKRVVVLTAHDSGWQDALALKAAGVTVTHILDTRNAAPPVLKQQAEAAGISTHTGVLVSKAHGRKAVQAVTITHNGGKLQLPCDALLMCGGWTPSLHLWSHIGGEIAWDDALAAYVPVAGTAPYPVTCLGACGGQGLGEVDTAPALHSLEKAGRSALHSSNKKAFIDFQNDVTSTDIQLAVREGFKSIEHIKRYTTSGMATDQGKLSNINALAQASVALGKPAQEIGLTTFRPPYTPQSFGVLAGAHRGALFQPVRQTPIDTWAEAQGAVFEPVAQWRRARFFPQPREDMHTAVARECEAVRKAVGMFDASTLGKIEVVGPDAAEFLNRIYTNPWKSLEVGKCRYGLLLREDGFIMDDGVSARMAENRFHLTTTTGGAGRVLAMMEDYLQTEWSDLNVWLTSTTEQWAVIAVQGPHARAVLEPLVEGIELDPHAFPHMAVREGKICGTPTRLFRVSFTGELGYEVNVPANKGLEVWQAIFDAGQAYGITPYGTEAMHVLRAEKGYIIVGQDTDGTLTPHDAGLEWAVGKKKPDFVGKRSLTRPDMVQEGRKQLVGLLTHDPHMVLEEGAQIIGDAGDTGIYPPVLGHVTSSYWSAALGRSIAIAQVKGGRDRMGQSVTIPMPEGDVEAVVSDMIFYDKKGERLNV